MIFIKRLFLLGCILLIAYALYQNFFGDGSLGYRFTHLHYEVQMLANGDALVTEQRTYDFRRGEFSRIFFELEDGIKDISVSEHGRDFDYISEFDTKRPEGKYSFEKRNGLTYVEFYIDAKEEVRTFDISYRVQEVTTLYDDCAIYFQKFLSEKNDARIDKLTATVNLLDNASNVLIWAHGPLDGEILFDKEDYSKVNLFVDSVKPNEYVEAFFVMDPDAFLDVSYVRSGNMRQRVIKEQELASNQADMKNFIINLSILLASLVVGVLIIIPIILRIKNKVYYTRHVPSQSLQYFRDIPENIPPALLDKLYNYYKGSESLPNKISATILDMIQRKVLIVSYQGEGKKRQTILTKAREHFDENHITEFEKPVISFLFEDVANGQNFVSMDMIKKYCKSKTNARDLERTLFSFTRKLDRMWENYDYEEKTKNVVPKYFKYIKVSYVLILLSSLVLVSEKLGENLVVAGLILFVGTGVALGVTSFLLKQKSMLNQRGEDKLSLWTGLYNFFNDFTLFEEKDLPELFMWEKYLVYATVLGVSKKVLKNLKFKYPQLEDENYVRDNMILYYSFYAMQDNLNSDFGSVGGSINNAITDAQRAVSSLNSGASTGGGGSFSSGGSFGGGGAGGSTGGGAD